MSDVNAGTYGAAPPASKRTVKAARKQAFSLTGEDMASAIACLVLPPLIFFATISLLSFRFRFNQPRIAWSLAFAMVIPTGLAASMARKASNEGRDAGWARLAAILLALAFATGCAAGDLLFWYFSQPFFLLDSLTAYDEVMPTEVDGVRLMDAGRVRFAEGTRLATDMAMSFTSWDIYCVAPITSSEGLPSQGSRLNSYDLWAVGVNCCSSAQANFHCGEYGDPSARGGLRQVSAEARPYFGLAVQQAEAAYNIEARHPLFFYWVKDPQKEQKLFFEAAFSNWVLANGMHFAVNAFVVATYVVLFARASKERDAHLIAALQL